MDEMRRGVIALDIAAPCLIHLSDCGRRLECFTEGPHDGALAVDLFDVLDRQLPAVAFDHAGVADLTARFGVEGILFEDQLQLITTLAKRERLGLSLGGVVADPFLLALLLDLDPLAPCPSVRRADDFSSRPRAAPLLPQCLLESLDVGGMSVL